MCITYILLVMFWTYILAPDDSECIAVKDWLAHVTELHADGDLGISQQYDVCTANIIHHKSNFAF